MYCGNARAKRLVRGHARARVAGSVQAIPGDNGIHPDNTPARPNGEKPPASASGHGWSAILGTDRRIDRCTRFCPMADGHSEIRVVAVLRPARYPCAKAERWPKPCRYDPNL